MSKRRKTSKKRKSSRRRKGGSRIISSRDTSFTRYYFITRDPDVIKDPTTEYNYITKLIQKILNDPRGWKKFGYKFKYISEKCGLKRRLDKKNWRNTFQIRLSSQNTVKKECNMENLSCADLGINVIYLNDRNFIFSTKQSQMNPISYQYYVVNHEIAHILNRGHNKWPNDANKLCPILSQQTVKNSPCIPNIYPLQSDFDLKN